MTYAFPKDYDLPTYFTSKHAISMTLRDYFAATALQGFITGSIEWSPTYKHPDDASLEVFKDIAQDSYAMADAMLKAREA